MLKADGDISLQAARNELTQHTDSKSSSHRIGLGYNTSGDQKGWTIDLNTARGRGSEDGREICY